MARNVPVGDRRLGYVGVSGGGAARPYSVPTTAPTAVRPFGAYALADAVERLGQPIRQEFQAQVRQAEVVAARESSAAGTGYALATDPDDLQLPPGDTIGEEAFRRSALQAASAKVEIKAREDVATLRQQFAGKPQDFMKALAERKGKFLGGLPQELASDASLTYERLGAAAFLDVDEERRAFERDAHRADLLKLTDQITTSAAQLARSGRYEAAMEELGHLADKTLAAGPVAAGGSGALSLTEIERSGLAASELIRKNFLEGWVERTPDKRRALAGLRSGQTGDAVVDGVLAVTAPDVMDQYARVLEGDIKQQEAEARAIAREREADARAARAEAQYYARFTFDDELAAAGRGEVANPDAIKILNNAYGERAAPMVAAINRAREAAGYAAEFATMTGDEIAQAVQSMAPAGEGYKGEAATQEDLARVASKVLADRAEKPAEAVMKAYPGIGELIASGDPAKMAQGLRQSVQVQQEVFGLPPERVQVLPPADAAKIVQSFKDAPTAEQRIDILSSYTQGLGDDALSGRVLRELEAKGLPADARLALERIEEGEIANARDIVAGMALDPKDLPKVGEATAQQIGQAVDARMSGTGPSGITAKLATMSRQPGLFARVQAERATMERLAREYVAAGDDAETAAQRAEKTVFGSREVAGSAELGYVRTPPGLDASDFTDALERARGVVDLSYLAPQRAPLRPGQTGTGAQEGQAFIRDRDFEAWAQSMRDGAMWVEAKGGYMLMSPAGEIVSDPNAPGKPRIFTPTEILGMGAQRQQPAAGMPPAGQTQRLGLPGELPADPWAPLQPMGQ